MSSLGKESNLHFLCTPKLFDIFSHPKKAIRKLKKGWWSASSKKADPFILVGLSLGGVLALDLSRQDFPQLKGLVLAGTQYKLNTNPSIGSRFSFFVCFPSMSFEKQDANKQQMLQILTELKGLNLTDTVKVCPLPSFLLFVVAEIGPINLLLKNWPSSCQRPLSRNRRRRSSTQYRETLWTRASHQGVCRWVLKWRG